MNNFGFSSNFTDITTGSQVTLVFNSSHYWFYGASVKTLANAAYLRDEVSKIQKSLNFEHSALNIFLNY